MKIAIVHEYMTKIGGAEKVLLEIHKTFPDAPIFTLIYDEKRTKSLFKNCDIKTSSLQKLPRFFRIRSKLLLPFLTRAIEEFDLSGYDIVLSSSNSYSHGVITKPQTCHICYSHSPMRYIWDWYHEYLKENKIGYSPIGLYIRSLLHKIRVWDYVSSGRVDFWIANSGNVAKRIKKYYRKDAEVLYPPTNIDNFSVSSNEASDQYLIISRLEPYKKIDLAILAFNKTGKKLIIIGEGSQKNALMKIANDNIEFLGWQNDSVVTKQLQECKALIFPGEEDFGLTVIEAMASGKPVIGLNKGGVTETVIPNKTGILFDQETPESLIDAIEKFEKSATQFDPAVIRKHAEQFSTGIFTEKLQSLINKYYAKYQDQKN